VNPAGVELQLPGAPDHGIFDPSVAKSETGTLYMSVSGVASTSAGAGLGALSVSTYLAISKDQGATWQLSSLLNRSIDVPLVSAPAPHQGRWQSEVSALVFDGSATPQARWKLFWHQYLNVNGERRFQHGWIAYKEAASPEGLAAANPVKLMTALAYDPVNDVTTSWTHSPIAGPAQVRTQDLAPDLRRCAAMSEPGVLAKPDALYLSLLCVRASPLGLPRATNQIVVLRCTRPCTAPGAWSYVGTALTQDDAEALGMRKFSASDLFSEGGRDFLTVSPVGTVPSEGAYKGCVVFQFTDLTRAQLARSAERTLHPVAHIALQEDSFNGACTFVPSGTHGSLLIGQVDFRKSTTGQVEPHFRVFQTLVTP
jgi:hypothetical protein